MAPDEKYPVRTRGNLTTSIQKQLSQRKKTFSPFFAAFLKSNCNFGRLEKKYDCHSFFISEVTDSQNVVRKMSKKCRLREPFDKQHRKHAQALLKSASHHFYHILWSLLSQLIWKKSLLLTCKILGLLVNTLAAHEKYLLRNRDNLTIPIQMQLSQKQKTFPKIFTAFLNSSWIFECLGKKIWLSQLLYFRNCGLWKRDLINV